MNSFQRLSPNVCSAALLGALGLAASPGVQAIGAPSADLCNSIPLTAGQSIPGDLRHQAFGNVGTNGTDFEYHIRLCNRTPDFGEQGEILTAIADYEIPFFGTTAAQFDGNDSAAVNEANIHNVGAPPGWAFEVVELGVATSNGWDGGVVDPADGETKFAWQVEDSAIKGFFDTLYGGEANNPFNDNTVAIRFYEDETFSGVEGNFVCGNFFDFDSVGQHVICPEDSLTGFTFDAAFDGTNAPDESSWALALPIIPNDPPLPSALGAPTLPNSPSVQRTTVRLPEPDTAPLLGLGALALGLGAAARRRRKKA